MNILSNISLFIVGAFHIYFFYIERFVWNTPAGLKIFKMSAEEARFGSILAANQGVYNLLLGLSLLFSMFSCSKEVTGIQFFILIYIVLVGIYGGATASKGIFFVQVLPSIICLMLLLMKLSSPMINDISTSFESDMTFKDKKLALEKIQTIQLKKYKYIKPLLIKKEMSFVEKSILDIIKNNKNWSLISNYSQNNNFFFKVEVKSKVLKFVDDILIKISQEADNFIKVDMRSRSRVGRSDFGANARRIDFFFKQVNEKL